MKKIWVGLGMLLTALLLFGACAKTEEEKGYAVFYLSVDVTGLKPLEYEFMAPEDAPIDDKAMELLQALAEVPDSNELRQTLPKSVEILGHSYNGYIYTVDFSEQYYDIGAVEEILTRAAVVKTLLQVPGISYVSFTVEGKPLTDVKGNVVGSMGIDSFVENPGEQINSSVETKLTLYFAGSDGTSLVKETRNVRYSSNISLEKLVMEQLMEGPKKKGSQGTIPTGTKLINISVIDRVCYVSLDENFKNQNQEISEQAVLFSMVNSLGELPEVDKVQVSINGNTSGKCRFIFDLDTLYEPDESLLEREEGDTQS